MFNVSTLFGSKKKKTNEILVKSEQTKVNETKTLLQKGDWSTAGILINDLIRKHPYNADCCWLFGRLCANRTQYDAAIFHFKQCIQLDANHADCYCTYGSTLGLMKKYNDEEEMYQKCLQLCPSHHLCHFNYGHLCEMRSDYKNAEKHFKQAIEGYNKDANYYIQYGILLKNVRRYDEALKNFEIAKTLDRNNSAAYYLYSKVLQSIGNINEAIKYLSKAIKLEPSNKEYQRVLHFMVRARPKPQIRKSESLALTTNNILCATPDGSNSYSYNNVLKKKQRSFTDENIKLTVINDNKESTNILKPPNVILNDYSNNNAPGANNNDEYFKKAVNLYENKQYDAAENILQLIISIKPNHEQAQRLYKYLSKKMYINNENIENNNNIRTRTRSNTPSIKYMEESKKEMDNNNNILGRGDPCQIEFIRFLDERVKLNKQYPDLYNRFEKLNYDDIRMIFDFDNEILAELNIKTLHCKTFMRKIKVFKAEADVFHKWLKKIVCMNQEYASMDGLIDRLENKGILTFESLYKYVLKKKDLVEIVGKEFNKIVNVLWNEIENQQKDLINNVNHSTPNPAYHVNTPVSPNNNTPQYQQNHGDDEGQDTALLQ